MKSFPLHPVAWRWLAAVIFFICAAPAYCQQGPSVRASVINGGDAQRSMVVSIALTFDKEVGASLQAEDLNLINLTTNAAISDLQLSYDASSKVATWTFPSQSGKSLPDGNYLAFIRPTDVTDADGQTLVPPVGSTTWTARFYRYFGDFDGDRDVDFLDTAKFQQMYGKSASQKGYSSAGDSNTDGNVDDADLAAFQVHYQSVFADAEITTPSILNPPKRTSQQSITFSGTAAPNSHVVITNGFFTFEGDADANGFFSITVGLLANRINSLFVTSTGATSAPSTTTPFTVTQDSTPPRLFVDFPADGSILDTESVTLVGRVADLLSGFDGLMVKVNGINAIISAGIGPNGTYEAKSIPLNMGENTLTVTATDALGNTVTKAVGLTRIAQSQVQITSGNEQTALRNTELPVPLAVRLIDSNGQAFPNKIVNFKVARSDGKLAATQSATNASGPMMVQVRTDAQGMAQAFWRLGSDAGNSNNQVTATSEGVAGTAYFRASAQGNPPNQINVGMGNNQVGEANGFAPLPLNAWASDNLNGAPNVPVTFTVTSGDAKVNGGPSITLPTDSTGHVDAILGFGPSGGPVTVEAAFPGLATNPAVFTARGLFRTSGMAASFNGVVQDNSGLAIGGATCTLNINGVKLPSVVSDDNGSFSIPNALPGSGYIQVDGRTATKLNAVTFTQPERYPSLVYRITVVPNAKNDLPTTVYLPTLNPVNTRTYDGTQDVELTIEGIAGLKMKIAAGSMTLADGTKPTVATPVMVSLNQVHADNIPMPIQDGVAPLLTWTLQPPGAHFEPPVQIQYPNLTNLQPGTVTNFLSYNHDVEMFEVVASGSVSTDGSVIKSDKGSGLLNSGWGCNCPPYAATGGCKKDPECTVSITSPSRDKWALLPDESFTFSASSNHPDGKFAWRINGASQTSTGPQLTKAFPEIGKYMIEVEHECQSDDGNVTTSSASVTAYVILPEYDPAKVFKPETLIGKSTYGREAKFTSVEWRSIGTDMTSYLKGDWSGSLSEAKEFLEWRVGNTIDSDGILFDDVSDPGDLSITHFENVSVKVKEKTYSGDSTHVVLFSPQTRKNFDQWALSQSDLSWLNTLPAPYIILDTTNSVEGDNDLDPEPSSCPDQKWKSPDRLTNFYHPDAMYEMRSRNTFGGQGHQATYDASGRIILSGLAAGSADRSAPFDALDPSTYSSSHASIDVLPFIRAAQIDANPVESSPANDIPKNLTGPLLRKGNKLSKYIQLRPALIPGKGLVDTGNCAQ